MMSLHTENPSMSYPLTERIHIFGAFYQVPVHCGIASAPLLEGTLHHP